MFVMWFKNINQHVDMQVQFGFRITKDYNKNTASHDIYHWFYGASIASFVSLIIPFIKKHAENWHSSVFYIHF